MPASGELPVSEKLDYGCETGLARRSCVRRNRAILFFRSSLNRLNRGRNEAMCYLSDESPVARGLSRRDNPRD